jgi:transketolase N-terminal domain/subunit
LNDRITVLENRKISSETAVLIAKGELSKNVDIKGFDVKEVKEGIDYWEIHFISKCADCLDNQPYVVVNKTNGEVVRFYQYGAPAN